MTYQEAWQECIKLLASKGFEVDNSVHFKADVLATLTAPEKAFFSSIASIYFEAKLTFKENGITVDREAQEDPVVPEVVA